MATTIHAGPSFGAALQGASDSLGTSRRASLEEDDNQRRNMLAQADMRRVQALTEATQLQTEMVEEGRRQAIEEARVEQVLFRQSLTSDGALREKERLGPAGFAELFKDARPDQKEHALTLLEGQKVYEQARNDASQLFMDLMQFGANLGEGAPPGMDAEVQGLVEALNETATGPLDLETLAALQGQFQQLRERKVAHRARMQFTEQKLADFDGRFGHIQGNADLSFLRAHLEESPEDALEVFDRAHQLVNPKEYAHTLEKERERSRVDIAKSVLATASRFAGDEYGPDDLDEIIDKLYQAMARNMGGDDGSPVLADVPITAEPSDADINALLDQGLSVDEVMERLGGE